jgi:hypothetical protein
MFQLQNVTNEYIVENNLFNLRGNLISEKTRTGGFMILDYKKLREEFEAKKKQERRAKFKKYDTEDEAPMSDEQRVAARKKQVFWEHLLKKNKV